MYVFISQKTQSRKEENDFFFCFLDGSKQNKGEGTQKTEQEAIVDSKIFSDTLLRSRSSAPGTRHSVAGPVRGTYRSAGSRLLWQEEEEGS